MATDRKSTDGRKHRKTLPRSRAERTKAIERRLKRTPQDIENNRRIGLYLAWKYAGRNGSGRKLGHYDGIPLEECIKINAEAAVYAKRVIEKMKENGTIQPTDDPRAVEALEGSIEVLRKPVDQRTKLMAAKIILEYTKSKPASETKVTVNKAEEWLAAIAGDDESDDTEVPSGDAEETA